MLIIGILSAVALPQYTAAVEKSRTAEAWSTLKAINDALAIRNLEMGTTKQQYPFEELSLSFTNENGTAVSGTEYMTKNFRYLIDISGSDAGSVAFRRTASGGLTYPVLSLVNGKRHCLSEDASLCKRLGMSIGGSGCTSGVGTTASNNCYVE